MEHTGVIDEVAAVLTSLDVVVDHDGLIDDPPRADIVAKIDDRWLYIEVKAFSRVRLSDALALIRRSGQMAEGSTQTVVAADRIDAAAGVELIDAGIGFWDRSGRRLVLRAPGLRIDTVIDDPHVMAVLDVRIEAVQLRSPFSGIGIRVAYWLLTHPDRRLGIRAVAKEIGASPTQVSAVAKALQHEHLLDQHRGVPDHPALFWELAEHWAPVWSKDLVSAERAVLEDGVVVGTLGAVAYGAPAVIGGGAPSLYLSRRVFVPAPPIVGERQGAGVRAAAAPAPQAAAPWGPALPLPGGATGRAGHPVAIALDLSTDRGRGREILADWELDPETANGATRVW